MTDAPSWATYIQAASWAAAAVTAIVGVSKFTQDNRTAQAQRAEALAQRKEEIAQRVAANDATDRELDWRRMAAAQLLLEKMEDDDLAADAMLMLDWDGRTFSQGDDSWPLRKAQIVAALRVQGDRFSTPEIYIRDCFDHLFWYFERIQHQIDIGLIEVGHVRFPIAYLIAVMKEDWPTFESFLDAYSYQGSLRLIAAFEALGLPKVSRHYEDLSGPSGDPTATSTQPDGTGVLQDATPS